MTDDSAFMGGPPSKRWLCVPYFLNMDILAGFTYCCSPLNSYFICKKMCSLHDMSITCCSNTKLSETQAEVCSGTRLWGSTRKIWIWGGNGHLTKNGHTLDTLEKKHLKIMDGDGKNSQSKMGIPDTIDDGDRLRDPDRFVTYIFPFFSHSEVALWLLPEGHTRC